MSLQTQIGPECNIFVPAPQHAEQIVLELADSLAAQAAADRGARRSRGVPNEFIDLQYDPSSWTSRARC